MGCVARRAIHSFDLVDVPKHASEKDRRALKIEQDGTVARQSEEVIHQVHQNKLLFLQAIQCHANVFARKENVDS
jgi:hypothetical protein